MNDDLLIRRTGELLESPLGDELVGLHLHQGVCFGFNATAARVWQSLDTPKRLSELRERMLIEFQVDAQTCDFELRALLKELEKADLITTEALPA